MMTAKRIELARLRSDLSDCRNPSLIKVYPHLGNPKLIEEIEGKIRAIELDEMIGANDEQ
jgi:hypothetical protein